MSAELLTLEGVSKSFGGVAAVSDVSLAIEPGALVALVGVGGAGKTTLIDLIAGACRPDAGRIGFEGRDITALPAHRRCAAGIARIFDPPRPFRGLSVLESVTAAAALHAPDSTEARHRAWDMLDRLGLQALAGQPAGSLEPVAARRLELARALATRPVLLLLDQILTEAPPAEAEWLRGVLGALNRRPGVALVLAEPRLDAVRGLAERVVLLDHGQLVTEVPADDLPD